MIDNTLLSEFTSEAIALQVEATVKYVYTMGNFAFY